MSKESTHRAASPGRRAHHAPNFENLRNLTLITALAWTLYTLIGEARLLPNAFVSRRWEVGTRAFCVFKNPLSPRSGRKQ